MSRPHIPLISGKSIWEYSPEGYRTYVRKLRESYNTHQAMLKASKAKPSSPVPGVTYRLNDKGTPIITIRGRKPKWLAPQEIDSLAQFYGVPQNKFWSIVILKGIPIKAKDIML